MRTYLPFILATILALGAATVSAQRHEIYTDRIATLQVVAGDDWLSPPVT